MTSSFPPWPKSFEFGAALLCVIVATGCASAPSVVRVRGDESHLGRVISPSAYALYMSALRDEARGDFERAESLYRATLKQDPKSGAAWAGLVRTSCHRGRSELDQVLQQAKHAADRPALALVAYATCLLDPQFEANVSSTALVDEAQQASREALGHEPLLPEASTTLAAALRTSGRDRSARHIEQAYALFAGRPLIRKAQHQAPPTLMDIDTLIVANQVDRALDAAAGILTPGEFSIRVLALGKAEAALQVASEVLINDPRDPNAHLAARLGTQDCSTVDQLCLHPCGPVRQEGLSPLARVLLVQAISEVQPGLTPALLERLQLNRPVETDPLFDWWLAEVERRLDTD